MTGLFEKLDDQLFQRVSDFVQQQGYVIHGMELYPGTSFGNRKFTTEVARVQQEINKYDPCLIIAHSLGAYTCIQTTVKCPLVLLEPSFKIADIILPSLKRNGESYLYSDGTHHLSISQNFIQSVKNAPSIEKSAQNIRSNRVHIFGAGKAGYKIAEQYHAYLQNSDYSLIPNADHDFSAEEDLQKIFMTIKNSPALCRAVEDMFAQSSSDRKSS